MLDMSLDIIEEEEELENEDEDILLDDEFMFMDPMLDIIFPIISSMPREGIPPPIPPIDIIVEDEDEEEEDLKLEIVDPSSDCVVAAMLWLLALSSFLTATPSSVTKAWLCAFMASDTWAPSGADITLGADTVRIPVPE